jgi:hypothetical protein
MAGARAAYQWAMKSGHPEYAPMAANNLGVLLEGQWDVAGARASYQWAIDSDHPEYVPLAREALAKLDGDAG